MNFDDILLLIPSAGHVLEFGVAHGSSFYAICAEVYPRKVYGFDSFRGLPEDWTEHYPKGMFDRGGVTPFKNANGEFVVGLVEDTLGFWMRDHPGEVAFCHFDLDLYKPTRFCLMLLRDRFVPGTVLLFDEYDQSLPGYEHEQRAFAEFKQRSGWHAKFIGRRGAYAHAFRLTERGATELPVVRSMERAAPPPQ